MRGAGFWNEVDFQFREKKIPIDIMLHGQFIATLRMPLRPWPFTEDEVREFVLSKLPTLRGEDFKVAF